MDAIYSIYLVGAVCILVHAILLGIQTWEHRRFGRSSIRNAEQSQPTGRALVCVPCKGDDIDLEENLTALLEQDYDDYEVAFVIESTNDPAVPTIRRVMAEHPWITSRLIVAGRAIDDGQKIHNLRVATRRLPSNIEYLAFMDSDARPRKEWLRLLLGPLESGEWGAVTGYRWFIPQKSTWVNHLVSSLNSDMMTLFKRSSYGLIWGGAWALTREAFEKIGLHAAWKNTLSDDIVAGRKLREAGFQVRFQPAAVVESPIDYTPASAFGFLRRQYQMVRFYAKDWWLWALLGVTLSNLFWYGNLVILAWSLFGGPITPWLPASVASFVYGTRVIRGYWRQSLAAVYFPHQWKALRVTRLFDAWFCPFFSIFHWCAVFGSSVGNRVSWRGILYLLLPQGTIGGIWREGDPMTVPMPHVVSARIAVPSHRFRAEPLVLRQQPAEPFAMPAESFALPTEQVISQ